MSDILSQQNDRLALALAFLALFPTATHPAAPPAPARDLHGDPLPPGAIARLGTARLRHGQAIQHLALSPDGKTLATVGRPDETIRLWNFPSGREQHRLKVQRALCVAFSPDGRTLASGSLVGPLVLCDLATGKKRTFEGYWPHAVYSLAFSPDGKILASGGRQVCLWDVREGKYLRSVVERADRIRDPGGAIAFSPDGKFLAAETESVVRLWAVPSGDEVRPLDGKIDVDALTFSPDGGLLAGAGPDGLVVLWDARTGRRVRVLRGHRDGVASLAFSPDGKTIASGGGTRLEERMDENRDNSIRLWDVRTGKAVRQLPGSPASVFGLTFSPDGKILVAGGEHVRLWDPATGRRLDPVGHPAIVVGAAFSGANTVVTLCRDGTTWAWDARTGRRIQTTPRLPRQTCYSPVLNSTGRVAAAVFPDGHAEAWDAVTGKSLHLEPVNRTARVSRMSPDGRALVIWEPDGRDGQLLVRDLLAGQRLRCRISPGHDSLYLAFSAAGDLLASVDPHPPADLILWDLRSRRVLHRLRLGFRPGPITFSPDGRTLVVCDHSQKHSTRAYEMLTGRQRWHLPDLGPFATACSFSPDGKTLSIGGARVIEVWDVLSTRRRASLPARSHLVIDLAFSPDGKLLVSGTFDFAPLVWDLSRLPAPVRPATIPRERLPALWAALAGEDASRAYEAIQTLAATPRDSVPFLEARLRPVAEARFPELARWVAELDSDEFEVRERAEAGLARAGPLAGPALRRALARKTSLEAYRRIERLLSALDRRPLPPTQVRDLRTVEALEAAGTLEARRLLREIARGAEGERLTEEARAALRRAGGAVK